MFKTKVGALALAAVLPLTAAAVAEAAPAPSAPSTSKITASVSDPTPASGKAFSVSGKFTVGGAAAANHKVKVQSRVKGKWSMLNGAKVNTASNGNYSLRVILNVAGQRALRVVGVGQGNQANAATVVNVNVH